MENPKQPAKNRSGAVIQVAVAVITYGDQLLLARRQAHQHEGGKLEFVGGKIEAHETPESALVREVAEELGLCIEHNLAVKMGRIHHTYAEKSVCLHVYQVTLNDAQYAAFKDLSMGRDGQAIGFYARDWAGQHASHFPAANRMILSWLGVPERLIVSHDLAHFARGDDWVRFYAEKLPAGALLSVRIAAAGADVWRLMRALFKLRADVRFILPATLYKVPEAERLPVVALSLKQRELMAWADGRLDLPETTELALIISVHDKDSIVQANRLAKHYPVWALMLSPVKPTATHPDATCLGWTGFQDLAVLADVPVVALGGMTAQDVTCHKKYGALGVAGIRGLI